MAIQNTNTKSAPTRVAELDALLAFAAEHGYEGSTAKLEAVRKQWVAPRTKDDAKQRENLALAEVVAKQMERGKAYTNAEIREGFRGLPVGSKGVVQPQKVTAVMAAGVAAGRFTKSTVGGKVTFYSLA